MLFRSYTAMTIAEYYRSMGLKVLLMADSTSRWAQALREMSNRMEELPGPDAFPMDLSSIISNFYGRAGYVKLNNGESGSITFIGTVSPAGGNLKEPVTENTKKVARCFYALEQDRADIDQDRVARVAIARQALEGGGGDVLVALDVISGDDEFLAELQLNLVFAIGVLLEPTAADLRTLQVNQGCDVAASGLGGGTEVVVDLEVVFRSAVGAVQTSNVHTSFNELQEVVVILGGRTDGVYDLGFTHECLPILVQFGSRRDCPICRNPVY